VKLQDPVQTTAMTEDCPGAIHFPDGKGSANSRGLLTEYVHPGSFAYKIYQSKDVGKAVSITNLLKDL